jgi:hypothetical protein
MSSQTAINTAVYNKLTSGTALSGLLSGGTAAPAIFFGQAPDNAALPYTVFLYPSELDTNQIYHRMKDIVMRVYTVASGAAQGGTIDAAIDTLLHNQTLIFSGTPATWTNIWMRRETGYQLITTSEAGIRYYTSGADYRVELTKG